MERKQNSPVITLKRITKSFELGSGKFDALKNVHLEIESGRLVAITGKSGSGKSTLLNVISGIDKPTTGNVVINGVSVENLSESALAAWRGKNIGIVFQFFQLIPTLTILENVVLPMEFCNSYPKAERKKRAQALLDRVGIGEQSGKFPQSLSGGQQQRAAIARALANDPPIIIADEPTGNLDSQNAIAIFELFSQLTHLGKTVIVVTHEREFAHYFEHTIAIADGSIVNAVPVSA